ncbi:hypothetical protein ScPMuIL_015676 [Solemya velum]
MQQPYSNSEALKRCLKDTGAPRSSQLKYSEPKYVYEPKPPYAAGKPKTISRPYSAPNPRPSILSNNQSSPWRNSNYQEPRNLVHLYNANTGKNGGGTSYAYPNASVGTSLPVPAYDALNDPHLYDYFRKRFGELQASTGAGTYRRSSSGALIRPSSAPAHRRRGLVMVGGKPVRPVMYKIAVTTGDKANAGTHAKIFLTIKGTRGKIPKTRLTKKAGSVKSEKKVAFRFAKGSTHVFKIKAHDIGDVKSLVIEHNGAKKEDSWYLQEIEIINTKTKKSFVFLCNQWLSLFHGDGQTQRQLYPMVASKTDYEIVTVTGDIDRAGTDAHVFVTIFGKSGVTPKLHLRKSTGNQKLYQRGQSDIFKIHANCVGPLRKIRIEHDNTGMFPGWYLDRVAISDLQHPKWKYYFPCGQWLARSEADGAISRDLVGSRDPFAVRKARKYKISVYTGDKRGAGTDANVYVTVFGENGDSGEKKLHSKKNNFERKQVDEFVIESACLGRINRLRIGHDNSGFSAAWFLDKVIVDDLDDGVVYEFPCGRWFAKDEDDGQISRDLMVNVGPMDAAPGIPYIITVTTGDKKNAGTDARVFIILCGGKDGLENSGKIWLETGKFQRGRTDIFNIDIAKKLSPLSKVEVGHDNSGAAAGWFLDQVIVYCASVGFEQFFPCQKWLATDEGEGLIQRTLYEQKAMRKKKEKKVTWYVWVSTSEVQGAGTDANVYLMAYGEKGKSDEILLENKGDAFEKGNDDKFKIEMAEIGIPYKIRVWHDNKGSFAAWHLKKVEMENMATKKRYIFPCDRWLAHNEDDHQIIREMPAEGPGIKKPLPLVKYDIEVHTGKKSGAGTDADVFVNIFGELGDTGNRPLTDSKTNRNKFEKGNVDEFQLEAVTLMKISKIRIGHNGKGAGAGWYLDKVVVRQQGEPKYNTVFECNRWLAVDEDDGLIERDLTASGSQMLSTTSYSVYVKTGDVRNAGTDAKVHLKIFGSKNDTENLQLRNAESTSNKFERARMDHFKLEATDIGKIKKIRIGHDDSSLGAGWFLDQVVIDIPSRGEHYTFACHRWLAKDEGDGQTMIELEPSATDEREKNIPYEVTVWTGEKSGAGTDANVFMQIYGEKGKTEEKTLGNKTDNFEQGQIDKFKVEAIDVGRIRKLRVGHDGKGMMSGWFLEKILIQRRHQGQRGLKFKGKRTTSADSRRQSILSTLQGRPDVEDEDFTPRSKAKRRQSLRDSGRKSADLKQVESDEEYQDDANIENYWFFVNRWFARSEDDGAIIRELLPTDETGRPLAGSLKQSEYVVKVHTGDEFGAGTDANVFINIFGENGDSGERQLKTSDNMNKFERNQEDVFKIEAIELGRLNKLKIRHDNKGGGAAWFLDRVEVQDVGKNKNYYFPCQRWLAVGKDDGQIGRELVPVDERLKQKLDKKDSEAVRKEIALETKAATTTYHVHVTTGKVWGAGTDANVYVILYGDQDNTGQMFLKSSKTHTNKFEKGKTDVFDLEAVNIGDLKKIRIGHDNAGGGAAWHLDKVVIDAPSLGKNWTFPCSRWLAKDEDDGQIEREIYPQELSTEEYVPCIPYEVKTQTGKVSSAGTSANVYIQLYGKDTCTEKKSLCGSKRERKDKFKKGTEDLFIVELEDVGDSIEKLRIGHDNAGLSAGWYLQSVQVRKLHETGRGSIKYIFPCDRWLARSEDDGAIERELVAQKAVKETIDKDGRVQQRDIKMKGKLKNKKYTVNVKTGDVKGAGTDANVFLNIFGENGDCGERKLHKSETYRDKFEKGQVDVFQLEAVDLGKVFKIKVRHDNSMISPAWYLDTVEVIDTSDNEKFTFHCERWLAKNKDDGKIERSFYIKGYDGDMSSTGTLRSTKIGSVGSLDSIRTTDPFSHSPRMNRKRASMEEIPEGPTIPYTVKVLTGEGEDNGTDSNVWVKVIGPNKQDTGRLFLELAQKSRFEPKSVEIFSLEAVAVREVKKIEVGHDGVAPGSGWFLKEVILDMPTMGKHYQFLCNQWLARDRGDGKTTRVFSVDDGTSSVTTYKPLIPYELTVVTGDVSEAGTDQVITLTVFGSNGKSAPMVLDKHGDRFERGREDLIRIELDDIAPLKKIRVETSGKGSRPSWFLEKMELRNMDRGILSVFKCNTWFGKRKDGVLTKDIPATERGKSVVQKTTYKISVKTSDVRGAGTDAGVYMVLFGSNGDSGELHLEKSENNKSPFENNQLDIFVFKDILSLSELSKCRVWHDNKGFGAAWHLAYIEVEDMNTRKVYTFHCDKWLSKNDDDKQILRELTCATSAKPDIAGSKKDKTTYEIEVTTTDKKDGGTFHNGWLILEGSKRSSKVFLMENSPQYKILRRGQVDHFKMPSAPLGRLERCIVGAVVRDDKPLADPSAPLVNWHCHQIAVTDISTGDKYIFPCKSWITVTEQMSKRDGRVLEVKKVEESKISTTRNLALVKYEVAVHTGSEFGGGTNANVTITLFGSHGDTGKRPLTQKFRDLFERNQVDKFQIEALDLGELNKVTIEHDNSGFRPGWFLDKIEVTNLATNITSVFPCGRWLDKSKDDCAISRDLYCRN